MAIKTTEATTDLSSIDRDTAAALNRCEQLTGFTFDIMPSDVLIARVNVFQTSDKKYHLAHHVDTSLGGTEAYPLHELSYFWPSASEWIGHSSSKARFSGWAGTCFTGVAIGANGKMRLFHLEDEYEQRRDIRKMLQIEGINPQWGVFTSGCMSVDSSLGSEFERLGLQPIRPRNRVNMAGIIIDPKTKKVGIGWKYNPTIARVYPNGSE